MFSEIGLYTNRGHNMRDVFMKLRGCLVLLTLVIFSIFVVTTLTLPGVLSRARTLNIIDGVSNNEDIIISGNETFTIENCNFYQTGNIIVNETGSLILRNATLILNQPSSHQYEIAFFDDAYLEAFNATITRTESSEGGYYMFMYDSTVANISESRFEYPATLLDARGSNVVVGVQNSHLDYINIGSGSQVEINKSQCHVHIWSGSPNVTIRECEDVNSLLLNFLDSASAILSLQPGYHAYWNLQINETVYNCGIDVTVVNSTIHKWLLSSWNEPTIYIQNSTLCYVHGRANAFFSLVNTTLTSWTTSEDNSTIIYRDSLVRDINAYNFSLIQLINTTFLQPSSVSVTDDAKTYKGWYLDATVLSDDKPQEGATVKAYHTENGSLCDEGMTGSNGTVRLILWEEKTNATGTYVYDNYTIQAIFDGKFTETSLKISGNTEVLLLLQMRVTLVVHVQRRFSSDPIEGVNVEIYKNGEMVNSTLTEENGDAFFQLEEGTYTIVAKRHLFRRIHRTKEKTVTITGDTTIIFKFLI